MKFEFFVQGEGKSEEQIEAIRRVIEDLAQTYKGAVISADPIVTEKPRQGDYTLIVGDNEYMNEFHEEIEALLGQGFLLLGGPVVAVLHGASAGMRYVQALYREVE
jgi:hypothetical protein